MSKYAFVMWHGRQSEFVEALQELGLVDVTTTGWEPDAKQSVLLSRMEQVRTAVAYLAETFKEPTVGTEPFGGEQALESYLYARARIDALGAEIERALKDKAELEVWGDFSPEELARLAEGGMVLRFFSVSDRDFAWIASEHGGEAVIEKISSRGGVTYFVAAGLDDEDVLQLAAYEYPVPQQTAAGVEARIASLRGKLAEQKDVLARVATSREELERYGRSLGEELDLSRAGASGERAADGSLVVMEGWATAATAARVDELLDRFPDVVYIKERPEPHDDVPVVLRNGKFSNPFEIIGQFYALPHYGSMDLTRFFAPFYMLFFGFCLGDAGYGLLLVGASFVLRRMKGAGMRQVARLTLMCGVAAVIIGFMVGSAFGIPLGTLSIFEGLKSVFIDTGTLFYIALGLGVVQIVFALILRIVNTTVQSGFKYALGTLGWLMVLVDGVCGLTLPMVGVGFSTSSPAFIAVLVVGGVLMLFFHTPGRNPLRNFGAGLWNTYNDLSGFLGDFLSYIRLFALCLSGGTLAVVFNQLAVGLAPDVPVLGQITMVVILLFGHTINLVMSGLGAFVHPMRLTFVEFYKNAGFEPTQRKFSPLKKSSGARE